MLNGEPLSPYYQIHLKLSSAIMIAGYYVTYDDKLPLVSMIATAIYTKQGSITFVH